MLNQLIAIALLGTHFTSAISLDVNDESSIKAAAKLAASGAVSYYAGSEPGAALGLFSAPYYWWESGLTWSHLIDYSHLTGDTQYDSLVSAAILAQVGQNQDFMPANQTKSEGNDDQATWALAALTAAEVGFPSPQGSPAWLQLAETVFNLQVARWNTANCTGGLRWQIFTFNNGYNYLNSQSNGLFFLLSARLARFTGNTTYVDWATKTYDWMKTEGLVSPEGRVYDGIDSITGCLVTNKIQWSASAGYMIEGATVLFNQTGVQLWADVASLILTQTLDVFFFANGTMQESACEANGKCGVDQRVYKSILARSLAASAQLDADSARLIAPKLEKSATAAAQSCVGASNSTCGFRWSAAGYDGSSGLGEELNALSIFQSLLRSRSQPAANGTANSTSSGPATTSGATSTSTSTSTTTPAPSSNSGNVFGPAGAMWLAQIGLFSICIASLF